MKYVTDSVNGFNSKEQAEEKIKEIVSRYDGLKDVYFSYLRSKTKGWVAAFAARKE